jgi:hypothetical protein
MDCKTPQYATICGHLLKDPDGVRTHLESLGLEGSEVFMDEIVSRDLDLFENAEGKKRLVEQLQSLGVKRLHCSYWAWPTSLLTSNRLAATIDAFGGEEQTRGYFGDLTGRHMFERWTQEYELAKAIGAQAYTFHLIDYAPIDGRWEFEIPTGEIRQAMVFMIQHLLETLDENGLIDENSPRIELENAGFGLEYGMQQASDAALVLDQLYDPHDKVRIAWDMNHLLHATGIRDGRPCFLLPENEKTEQMHEIEESSSNASELEIEWLRKNLLDNRLAGRIGAVHLSDCVPKTTEFFVRGKLAEPYHSELVSLGSWDEMEEYGVKIVLEHYDSHVPVGRGSLRPEDVRKTLEELASENDGFVILHELKNSEDIFEDVSLQKSAVGI